MTHKAVHFGPDIHSHQSLKAPLLLVMALLKIDYVSEDAEEGYSPEQLLIYMRRFERAIYEELIGRVTGVFINRYSIDSIFAAPLQ
ncbi:hypothetical protein EDC30_103219 [Paucimonas lemoignei]|uniref:Uncharacterized protein n=2 Tax=Paucimonas lemoignei TaxID=29443 RepID=A0A4R3HX79_PAULE|nr:hypothetical protein EDC30_103219 [Paucimonas lemoignei]